MKRKIVRLFFVVMLSLVVIGFYSTTKIVFAKGGTTSASGWGKHDNGNDKCKHGKKFKCNKCKKRCVRLQKKTPGKQQKGNISISSTALFGGNVGIGTTDPEVDLHIYTKDENSSSIRLEGNSTLDGSYREYTTITRDASALRFIDDDGGESFTIRDNNKGVGIGGVPNPIYPLEMRSGAHVTAGGVWRNASSRDYKENIKELSYNEAFRALQNLTPVTYNYKVDKEESCVGFIAEDVPDIVATKDRKSISPMDIVAVLTKVVQKQQDEIEHLKVENRQLSGTLKTLADRQEDLEKVFLAISTTLKKEKPVKYNQAGLDEVQKAVQ